MRKIVYWVATGVVVIVFLLTGIGNLIPISHIAQDMARLGYPPYFLSILGTWKVLGALTILFSKIPRTKEWAYAGLLFDLTGAAFSRLALRDDVTMVIIPIVIACFVITSWAYRPEEGIVRRLAK